MSSFKLDEIKNLTIPESTTTVRLNNLDDYSIEYYENYILENKKIIKDIVLNPMYNSFL